MRRLARHTLNALTVLSLLLCVATVGLWVRSYYIDDALGRVHRSRVTLCGSSRGQIFYCSDGAHNLPEGEWRYFAQQSGRKWGFTADQIHWRITGAIGWDSEGYPFEPGFKYVVLRHWAAAALLAALPALWLTSKGLSRRHRRRAGTCASCGYDLRATPTRCPECATIPAKPVQ